MNIKIKYDGEPVTIMTGTDEPDETTGYTLNLGASLSVQQGITRLTVEGLGAFGHRMGGVVNNRDLISALANDPKIELIGEYPMTPYIFPEGTVS